MGLHEGKNYRDPEDKGVSNHIAHIVAKGSKSFEGSNVEKVENQNDDPHGHYLLFVQKGRVADHESNGNSKNKVLNVVSESHTSFRRQTVFKSIVKIVLLDSVEHTA